MARTAPRLAGRLLNSSGAGISGATVHVYDAGTTTPSRADVATGSDGSWAIGPAESGDAALTGRGAFDVQLNDGTTKLRIVQNTEAQFKSIELVNVDSGEAPLLVAQMSNATSVPVAIFEGDKSTSALGVSATELDDDEAYISFRLANDADEQTEMVRLTWAASDVSDASEDGRLEFQVMVSASMADKLQLDGTALSPMATGGLALGTAALEWGDVFIADDKYIKLGSDQNIAIGYDEDGDDSLEMAANVEGAALAITYKADQGDDNADIWKQNFADGGTITWQSKTSGSFATKLTLTPDGDLTVVGELDAATLDLSSSADIAGDLVLSGGADGALQFSNAGENSIKIPDNQASALIIEEADNAYITFVTTNSSEAITVAKATTFSAGIADAGTIAAGTWNGTAIASSYIAADAITGAKIADDAIDSEHYTDGSIDNAHIADDAIDSEHYAAGSIDTAHIADNQITLAKMAGLARGKIIYGDASGDPAALAVGTAGYALAHDGTDIAYTNSLLAADYVIGEDSETKIDFETANEIHFDTNNAERARIDSAGQVFIGDTANANSTVGLTINAGTNTDHHLALKFVGSGTGFEQPATGNAEIDTYGFFKASHGAKGGLKITGLTGKDQDPAVGLAHSGLYLEGWTSIATDTTHTNGGYGAVRIGAKQTNGGIGVGAVGSNGNLVSIDTDNTTRFIFDAEGDFHYDGSLTELADDYDDAHLIRALDHARETMGAKGLIKSKWDDFITYSESTLIELGILGDTLENGGLINMTGLQRLHNGAIWQGYQRQCEMQEQIKVLENKLLALEAG